MFCVSVVTVLNRKFYKMYSRFPISMENIPRQRSFGCLSLRFGCIFTALVIIMYTVLAIAQCSADLETMVASVKADSAASVLDYCFAIGVILCHCVTVILTAVMLVGTLREKPFLMEPWIIWMSCQLMGILLLYVFWTIISIINNTLYNNFLIVSVGAFLGLLIRFYMLMLVNSFYKQLVEERIEERISLHVDSKGYTAV